MGSSHQPHCGVIYKYGNDVRTYVMLHNELMYDARGWNESEGNKGKKEGGNDS